MKRRQSLAIALIALPLAASVAQSQRKIVRPPTITLPLHASARLELSGGEGCGQSYGESHNNGTLELTIDAQGAAELRLEGTGDTTVHAHPLAGGASPEHRVHSVHHLVFRGPATINGRSVSLTLAPVEQTQTMQTPTGTQTLASSTSPLQLQCDLARAQVLPALAAPRERATRMQTLRCSLVSGTAEPLAFSEYGSFPIDLGLGSQLRSVTTRTQTSSTRVLRLPYPPSATP